ncbi:MAG: hypothetical protein ACRDTX_08135 [Pseudonocardiaceae bacterium]
MERVGSYREGKASDCGADSLPVSGWFGVASRSAAHEVHRAASSSVRSAPRKCGFTTLITHSVPHNAHDHASTFGGCR